LTNAERQARFRQAHANGQPKLRYRRPADKRSRPQRWRDAVNELVNLQEEYRTWLDTGLCRQSLTSTSPSLRASSRLEDLAGIDDPPCTPGSPQPQAKAVLENPRTACTPLPRRFLKENHGSEQLDQPSLRGSDDTECSCLIILKASQQFEALRARWHHASARCRWRLRLTTANPIRWRPCRGCFDKLSCACFGQ